MAKILVVDDSEEDRLFERALLEDRGHELFYAADGEHALESCGAHDIDLVVTDLHMPHVNGLRLIKELRERDARIPIIAVSGVARDQLDIAKEYGAVRTLIKPLDPARFVAVVDEVLAEGSGDVWAGHDL